MKIDNLNLECSWEKVDVEWYKKNNIANAENIEESREEIEGIEIIYKNGDVIYYKKVHGSYGFPYVVR